MKKKTEITIFALVALLMISMAVNYVQRDYTDRLQREIDEVTVDATGDIIEY